MHFVRLCSPEHEIFPRAMALYTGSFPAHEQRERDSQRSIMGLEDYHFDLIYDGETFVGLMLYWETPDFKYVEHFCIDPGMRSRQYGQRALELLGSDGKSVILEIDPPADSISLRRKGFYQRCGYQENPFPHVHPPYHTGNQGHPLVVLSYPETLNQVQYDRFYAYLRDTVMGMKSFQQ